MTQIQKQKNKAFQYFPISWGWQLTLFFLLMVFFVFLAGWLPLFNQEAYQGLMVFEMIKTENYLAPSLHGELQSVSPLYTWFLTGVSQLIGDFSLVFLRITSLGSLLLFGLMVYYYHKKYLGINTALLIALTSVSTVPVLFSFVSWGGQQIFTSMLFMGFLLFLRNSHNKGFPLPVLMLLYAFIFLFYLAQGVHWSLLALAVFISSIVYYKKTKVLISARNAVAFFFFLALVGVYYFLIHKLQPGYISSMMTHHFKQTLPGLIISSSWIDAIHYSVNFIKSLVVSLLPWLVFFPFLFIIRIREQLKKNKHIKFSGIAFLITAIIFFVGTDAPDEPLLILGPFLFPIIFHGGRLALLDKSLQMTRIYRISLNGILFLFVLGSMSFVFFYKGGKIPSLFLKTSVLFILFSNLFFLGYKHPRYLMFSSVVAVFFFALFLKLFPVEDYLNNNQQLANPITSVVNISEKYSAKSLYLQVPLANHPVDLNRFSFLLQLKDNKVIYNKKMVLPGAYYIMQPADTDYALHRKVDEFNWAGKTWYIVTNR